MNTAPLSLTPASPELPVLRITTAQWDSLLQHLDQYQEIAAGTDQNQFTGTSGLAFPFLGLFGEVGTLVSALKKRRRDGASYARYSEAVLEEFGDVLWYFSSIASRASLRVSDIAEQTALKMRFAGDAARVRAGSPDSQAFEAAVIQLAGNVGLLLNAFSSGSLHKKERGLRDHLAEFFAALAEAAELAGVDLKAAADFNVAKIHSRWPPRREYAPAFDAPFPDSERLPRTIEMHIVETTVAGQPYVIQLCNGIEIGSRLTDNKLVEDDYRFHDVFHLSYAAFLGWSPCLRALLKRKRKSDPAIDQAEDGARAILIEEGVSTFVFHHALRMNYFATLESIDYPLLKSIRDFVTGFEVDRCALWQWENAILRGFEVFRQLRAHRRGIVTADLVKHTLSFVPVTDDR